MAIQDLAFTVLAIFLGSVGQLMIKIGMTTFTGRCGPISINTIWSNLPAIFITPQILIAAFCFLLSSVFWALMMSKRDLCQIYPFIALSLFFVSMLGYFILHENIGVWRMAGIVIIIIGVIVLAQDKIVSIPH